MKKEKPCFICDICFVFLISLLWYILIFYAIPNGLEDYNKPDFKITKEVCEYKDSGNRWYVNLHEELNITIKKSELPILNREILEYRFFEKAKEDYNFTSEYYGCVGLSKFPVVVIYEDDLNIIYHTDYLEASPCYKNEKVCEDVEVEELIKKEIIILTNITKKEESEIMEIDSINLLDNRTLKEFCEDNNDTYYEENDRLVCYDFLENKFPKEYLTIEMLEQNCGCIENKGACFIYYDASKDYHTPIEERRETGCIQRGCSKYKCEFKEEYFVEVLR